MALVIMLVILLRSPSCARELSTVSCSGLEISFPPQETAIVSRMAAQAPQMVAFLAGKGLPVKSPIYVILDDDLDIPDAVVHMIPHREIRIPLKAPGVLEEGYLEEDPWSYFLFKGLCLQGIYSSRGGLPAALHGVFGEIVSPNLVNPPWLLDGVFSVLLRQYEDAVVQDPFQKAMLSVPVPADISRMTNHPEAWPGYYGYRVYGGPFMEWLVSRHGWDAVLRFMEIHGKGIIPIEIELKAEEAFGSGWAPLWSSFITETSMAVMSDAMTTVTGYVQDPLITWDHAGISRGPKRVRIRGRYGFLDGGGTLWVSEYDREGVAHLVGYPRTGSVVSLDTDHLWDPGMGAAAVTRRGSRPHLVILSRGRGLMQEEWVPEQVIPAPEGVIQVSGPVMDGSGRVAVSANMGGNWDIWVYSGSWERITWAASVELDPWWDGDALIFASNASGTFQIHRSDMEQLTRCGHAAMLPRGGSMLCLAENGWSLKRYPPVEAVPVSGEGPQPAGQDADGLPSRPYTPWGSVWPNFISPDLYVGLSEVQVGLATWARDVSGDYGFDAGARYSFSYDYVAVRAGASFRELGIQASRYPFVIDPVLSPGTEESRVECRASYTPDAFDWMEASLNALHYGPLEHEGDTDVELFAALGMNRRFESLVVRANLEAYSGGRKSLFGGLRWIAGRDIYGVLTCDAGRTWGEYAPGHGTFRIGGDTGEGYFTSRPSRLFPVRGYAFNILEADRALASSMEAFWPVANIQQGHGTLPVYLHRIWLGTFVDSGFCSEGMSLDDAVVGAGFEVVTSLEVAWGNLSSFRVGMAWPARQPGYLHEKGPLLVLQIGMPL